MLTAKNLPQYIKLMRADSPIGTYLVLWPTLWALWFAAEGMPSLINLVIFSLGSFTMRSAGCVINDYADRNVDKYVTRTKDRPLTAGRVTEQEAKWLFLLLIFISVLLVAATNIFTMLLAPGALLIASIYPFMKRYTHLPQVVLGAAFSWSIPMAFAAEMNALTLITWLLFIANLLWVVAYDTYYAMVDRDDDIAIGIRSTAILFGHHDRTAIALLQLGFIGLMAAIGWLEGIGLAYYVALLIAAGLFIKQSRMTKDRERMACLKAFLNNNHVGWVILLGLILGRL